MSDRADSIQPKSPYGKRVGALTAASLAAVISTFVACGGADPREVAETWATANAECGTDAVRRAYDLERRRSDEDPLDVRLREAREKPCPADGPKPVVKSAAVMDERDDLTVVHVDFLYFPGSATARARVVLVKSAGDWKVDTAQSRHV